MGDCDGVTQSERRRLFPVTVFDVIAMVSPPDLITAPIHVSRIFLICVTIRSSNFRVIKIFFEDVLKLKLCRYTSIHYPHVVVFMHTSYMVYWHGNVM